MRRHSRADQTTAAGPLSARAAPGWLRRNVHRWAGQAHGALGAVWFDVADLLLPRGCVLCESMLAPSEAGLCDACKANLPGTRASRCPVCAARTNTCAGSVGITGEHDSPCPACAASPPPFAATLSLADYRPPLDRALVAGKFHGRWALLAQLAEAWCSREDLVQRLRNERIDCLVPVPLSPARLLSRGYNQADQIARGVSRRLGIPCRPALLHRRRDTGAQSSLSRIDREANLRDAFACRRPAAGLRIAVVDDVMTTGASLNEAARTLRQAAAPAHVTALALARTEMPD